MSDSVATNTIIFYKYLINSGWRLAYLLHVWNTGCRLCCRLSLRTCNKLTTCLGCILPSPKDSWDRLHLTTLTSSPRKRWGNKETCMFWVPQLFVVHHCCHLLDLIPSYHCHILRIHVLYTFWINTSSVAIFKESRHVLQPFTTTCSVAKTFSKESLLDRCSYHILCLYFGRLYITVWQSCKASGQITAH